MLRTPIIALFAALCGCSGDARPQKDSGASVRLWHSFNDQETEALNGALAARRRGPPVEVTLVPFTRGFTVLGRVFAEAEDCPDLVRIDASWLPALARADLLLPAPGSANRNWLPEAADLATLDGTRYGLPQSIDGLALIYKRADVEASGVHWPPSSLDELERAAESLGGGGGDSLGVRVDGFWFAAFLRAAGGDILDPNTGQLGIDRPVAAQALTRFAGLFGPGGVSATPPAPGAEERDEIRRFRGGSMVVTVNGPWAAFDLGGGEMDELAVTAFPAAADGTPSAPRGGKLFVVPRCAKHTDDAWQLAMELTSPELQARWASRFGIVPTTPEALAKSGDFSRAFHGALERARPLPRHPITPEMFDDLTPAIAAVVNGDATAQEALAGTARAWTRLLARHSIQVAPPQVIVDGGVP